MGYIQYIFSLPFLSHLLVKQATASLNWVEQARVDLSQLVLALVSMVTMKLKL